MEEIPSGFKFYSGCAGFYGNERPDTLVVVAEEGALVAGVFTTNALSAAPVKVARELLKNHRKFSGVVANAGCANAATGKKGVSDAKELISFTKEHFGLPHPLLPASTGVIGQYLPLEEIKNAIKNSKEHRDLELAARTIMTTDTFPKTKVLKSNEGYTLAGITKGAGMIAPSLATTLTFVFTDADFHYGFLKKALLGAVQRTFNRISVDGEQSTNDAVILLSSRKKSVSSSAKKEFEKLLQALLYDLSLMVLKDGEGATKIIKVFAEGFLSQKDADNAARRVALSLLVRTAFYGADPNWGRIFSALGDSGVKVDEDKLKIWIGSQLVYDGKPVEFSREKAVEEMRGSEVEIRFSAGLGRFHSYFMTCDLTEKYIEINSSYTS